MSYNEYTPDPFNQNQKPLASDDLNSNFNSLFQMLRMGSRHGDPSKGGGGAVFVSLVASGTATTVDSSIDWRDRMVTIVTNFFDEGSTPEDYVPGGARDGSIGGKIEYPGSGNDAQIFTMGIASFYSQAGGDGSGSPWVGITFNNALDLLLIWADQSDGSLKMKIDNPGTKLTVNALIAYSPDYGFY